MNELELCVFSGTGNTLKCAKELQAAGLWSPEQ